MSVTAEHRAHAAEALYYRKEGEAAALQNVLGELLEAVRTNGLDVDISAIKGLQEVDLNGTAEVTTHPLKGAISYYKLQERGDGMLFARLLRGRRLYDHTAKVWARFENGIWSYDWTEQTVRELSETLTRVYLALSKHLDDEVVRLTKESADNAKIEKAGNLRDALRKRVDDLNRARRVNNADRFAQLYLATETKDFDPDPYLFNVLNGTYDLQRFIFRDHDPEDKIRKRTPVLYDAEATCPKFLAFLERIQPDPELQRMIQVITGCLLTGLTDVDALFFFYGTGGNGKTVLLSVLEMLLGDYYLTIPIETLLAKNPGATDAYHKAQLHGVRCCVSSEIPQGRRLNESLVKDLTGGDTVTGARNPYGKPFTFKPTHKLILVGNHKPVVRGTDDGIWRRIRLIPFLVQIPKEEQIDRSVLLERFGKELSGILNWAIEGYRIYREKGLPAPPAVRKATEDYRSESDPLGSFIDECCVRSENVKAIANQMYQEYKRWCEEANEHAKTRKDFYTALRERGFTVEPGSYNKTEVKGLALEAPLGC